MGRGKQANGAWEMYRRSNVRQSDKDSFRGTIRIRLGYQPCIAATDGSHAKKKVTSLSLPLVDFVFHPPLGCRYSVVQITPVGGVALACRAKLQGLLRRIHTFNVTL